MSVLRTKWVLIVGLLMIWVTAGAAPFVVVIDAGHGGKDPGAVGAISKEKDLNLAVALRLGKMIEDAYDKEQVRVVYTRKDDIFIPLQGRADIVNRNNANLFICIHTNAADNRSVSGAETFVLGTEKMDKNLDVAMRENAVMTLESDYQTTYQGFDPNSIESYIMFEMMQNNYMDQSLNYATILQRQFSDTLRRADRGVRQAAFWVLLKSACPSVLVEMGFISNREEERYLASEIGKQQMAQSMFDAFRSFYRPKPAKLVEVDTTFVEPATRVESITVVETAPVVMRYAVQILASKTPLDLSDARFCGIKEIGCIQKNGWYKYYTAATETKAEAQQQQAALKKNFPDCYVVKID